MPDHYAIDGNTVNDRDDWRHRPPVAPLTSLREEGFPGSGTTFVVTGSRRGARLTVEGHLQGETFAALHAEVAAAEALRVDSFTHNIKIQGVTYKDCQLMSFDLLGGHVAFRKNGSRWIRVAARYVWQQLTTGGAS